MPFEGEQTRIERVRHGVKAAILGGIVAFAFVMAAGAQTAGFPQRATPIPETTNRVPHVQIGVTVSPEIYDRLLIHVSNIPGVSIRDTIISLPGAKGFWIDEAITLARPQAIVRGREFAHVHPDGSLHASLPEDVAIAAVKTGWAIHHPWSGQRPGWEGFVMIYTPQSEAELDVVLDLVRHAYRYVTGRS